MNSTICNNEVKNKQKTDFLLGNIFYPLSLQMTSEPSAGDKKCAF